MGMATKQHVRARTASRGRHWRFAALVPVALALLVAGCARVNAASGASGTGLAAIGAACSVELVSSEGDLRVRTPAGSITGAAAGRTDLDRYVPLFVREFSLYPPDLVKRTGLRRVVFCRELAFAGQRRNAVPDFRDDTLYLDVQRGSYSTPYLRKVIHHEFFHIIDYCDDGMLYLDPSWAALNGAGFTYGSGGRNAQEQGSTSVLTDRYPGFLNHYSTTAVEEDKAEVFANMMVDPVYVERRAADDRVLSAKVGRMKKLLARFCPDVNDGFWERVRTHGGR